MDAYLARLKQIGNSNSTINKKISALSFMMTHAIRRGKLKARLHLERLPDTGGRIRFLTRDEEANCLAVLEQWGKSDHADAFSILIDTGLRPGELWALQLRDLDMDLGLIHVWLNKTHKPRSVPMTERVKDIIIRRRSITQPLLFSEADNFWFEHVWDRMKFHLGLTEDEQFVPYALRHTCASRLVQKGVHLQVVQEWMGHKSIQTTLRYAHLCPKNLMDAVKVLEAC
jgi:integrase